MALGEIADRLKMDTLRVPTHPPHSDQVLQSVTSGGPPETGEYIRGGVEFIPY